VVLKLLFKKLNLKRLFRKKSSFRMGIYGSPNAGKTTLANAMSRDFDGDAVGSVSEVPHETRRVLTKQSIVLKNDQGQLVVDVMDTPGLASRVDPLDFELMYNMDADAAAKRAEEATRGILEAIEALDGISAMLLVIDCAADPYTQVNQVLLTHVRAKRLPMIVVANKADLPTADPARLQAMFKEHPVIAVSAKTGQNLDVLYDQLISSFGW
jgi:GTPase